ncbi:MAG: hypothetical protein Q8927_19390, partial [Bacteroidota bacterium]|nr:hypothetical protein [Bacteroidota bacterium]
MKRLIHLLAAGMLIIAITPGCKKSFSSLPLCNDSARLIAEAHKWFQLSVAAEVPAPGIQANPRINSPKSPVWDQARTLELSDRSVVIVPLHYKAPIYLMNHAANSPLFVIDQVARLVIYRDSLQNFRAEVVTALPDSSFSQDAPLPFHGLLLIENWSGTLLYRLHSDGRNLLISNPAQQPSTIAAGLITETCYEIVGYNYAADAPTNG